MLLLNCRRVL
uniref:Uncharacterized protein n=1 Tax=Arundo donax TaxID=35708 RepID=A0A0A8Z0Y7_ARUDO